MKKRNLVFTTAIIALLVFSSTAQSASDAPPKKVSAVAERDAEFKEMISRGLASQDETAILEPFVGDWKFTATVWAAPDSEGMRSDGSAKNELVLNDRYLRSSVIGALNINGSETPIKGEGMIGYDTTKKTFTSVWADTLSPGMMVGKAIYDPKKKSFSETGQLINPLTGKQENFHSETQSIDSGSYKKTLFIAAKGGKETKLIEFLYSRNIDPPASSATGDNDARKNEPPARIPE